MKKLHILFAGFCILLIVLFQWLTFYVKAEAEELKPAESENLLLLGDRDYRRAYDSYLLENADGTISRVEQIKDSVIVETYSESFALLNTITLPMELPLYGGFYAGEQYNFLITGQNNEEQDDNKEVIRVIVYSKAWERIRAVSIMAMEAGVNVPGLMVIPTGTKYPFDAGCVRCCESEGKLWIYTAKEDYGGHEESLLCCVDEKTWEGEMSPGFYAGHSFDQYIFPDEASNVTEAGITLVDLCDANPKRSVLLQRVNIKKYYDFQYTDSQYAIGMFPIYGKAGDTYVGCYIGGVEQSSTHYIAAVKSIFQQAEGYEGWSNVITPKNIFISVVPKDGTTDDTAVRKQITNYTQNGDMWVTRPRLVKLAADSFLLMWEEEKPVAGKNAKNRESESHAFKYVFLDGKGDMQGAIRSIEGKNVFLSYCQPVVYQGKVAWYGTNNSAPVFYTLNPYTEEIMIYGDTTALLEYNKDSQNTIQETEDEEKEDVETVAVGDIVKYGKFRYRITAAEEGNCTAVLVQGKNVMIADIPAKIYVGNQNFKVTGIGAGAFKNCRKLETLLLNRNIKTIGKKAFMNCKKLSHINDGRKIEKVGSKAFKGCKDLYTINTDVKGKIRKIIKKQAKTQYYVRWQKAVAA